MRWRAIGLVLCTCLPIAGLIVPTEAFGFTFSPIVVEFDPQGPGATQTFTAENKGQDKIPVQITAHLRAIDIDGEETLKATDHFRIFPEQFVLAPAQSRVVRITYKGPKSLKSEAAYRFIAEQLPVEMAKNSEDKSRAHLKFLIRYESSIYVTPDKSKSDVRVRATTKRPPSASSRAREEIELVLENVGTAHQLLTKANLTLKSGKSTVQLTPDQLKVFEKQNLLAGSIRRFHLKWPQGLPKGGDVQATLSF